MTDRTIRESVAAASFAFVVSAMLCGAILVATMSAAPAQQVYFPTPGASTIGIVPNNSGFFPNDTRANANNTPGAFAPQMNANPNSAVQSGAGTPTSQTLNANSLLQGGKK